MGFFDFFRRQDPDSEFPENFSSHYSKSVKVVCKTDENGIMKCKKYTQSSDNPSVPSYEEQKDYSPYDQTDFENEFQDFANQMKMGFSLFNDLHRSFGMFEDFFERSPRQDFFFRPPNFSDPEFSPEGFPKKFPKPDTNIYDI